MFAPVEEICTGSTVSQRLAEAHPRNSALAGTKVPPCTADFSDIFCLPERWTWDHIIELVLDAKLADCKVYLISLLEQKEINAFIAEGLSTSHIFPLKAPMVSLVFLIKKKDSALQFVQDYRAFNVMTEKSVPAPLNQQSY
jgi:hypothetical protein